MNFPMKFCLITTFFGTHSFGGDAGYVDHLSRALLRRGHEVTIIYCRDAYEVLRGDHPGREYTPPAGLKLHALQTRFPLLNQIWAHQTGGLGAYRQPVQHILNQSRFDVVHFHNISLIGGLELLALPLSSSTVKIMTAHEHWLTCPLSLLWKLNREVCQQPQCIRCTLYAKRPPQFWRSLHRVNQALAHLDGLIFPSKHARNQHHDRGIRHPHMIHLPYFLPEEWVQQTYAELSGEHHRPYFLLVGRMIKEKGFHEVIPVMAHFPEIELHVAGTGPALPQLKSIAAGLENVRFLGLKSYAELIELYRHAVALIVPSLFYETFGFVVMEAFSSKTPVIVRDRGPLPELVHQSQGGLIFRTEAELIQAMKRLYTQDTLRHQFGKNGYQALRQLWSENTHLERYLAWIEDLCTKKVF